MAFRLAEAFVELTMRDSLLVAGLARVDRSVARTTAGLEALSQAASLNAGNLAAGENESNSTLSASIPNLRQPRIAPSRELGTDVFRPSFPQNVNRDPALQAALRNFGVSLSAVAQPLRALPSLLERLSTAGGGADAAGGSARSTRPSQSVTDNQVFLPALLGQLAERTPQSVAEDRAHRQRQRQLEALLRLDENVNRILQIQQSGQDAATAVFAAPA